MQSNTRKKEVARKREAVKTGGGPAPVCLKNWEEKVIGVLSDNVLSGIPGGLDTCDENSTQADDSIADLPSPVNSPVIVASCSGLGQVKEIKRKLPTNLNSEQRVKVNSNQPCASAGSQIKKPSKTIISSDTVNYSKRLLDIEEEKLAIKKERLELEKKKVELLQELVNLKKTNLTLSPPAFAVSPVIKFI